jgi:predicted Zn-dependent peptidase
MLSMPKHPVAVNLLVQFLILIMYFVCPPAANAEPQPPRIQKSTPSSLRENSQTQEPRFQSSLKSREDNGPFVKVVFRNDLTLVIKEDHGIPLASLNLLIKLPPLNPTSENELMIRVAAEALFSFDDPNGENPVAALGGICRKTVTPANLRWNVTVPVANLQKAISIIARRLMDPRPTASAPNGYLKRIAGDLLQQSEGRQSRELFILGGFPPSFQVPDEMSSQAADSLRSFMRSIAQGRQIVISVVGDVDREKTIQGIVENLLNLPSAEVKLAVSSIVPTQVTGLRYFQIPSFPGHAGISLYFPSKNTPQALLELLASLLTQGEISTLGHELSLQRSLALSLSAQQLVVGKERYFSIAASSRTERLDELSVGLITRLRSLAEAPLSDDELLRARQQFLVKRYRENAFPSLVSERLAEAEAASGYSAYGSMVSEVQKVNAEDIHHLVTDLLVVEKAHIIEQWPMGQDERSFSSESYADFLALTIPRSLQRLGKKVQQASSVIAIPSERTGPYLSGLDRTQLKAMDWARYSILRGPNVFVAEYHLTPLVTILALYPGGQLLESQAQAGMTALALLSAIQSVKDKTHDELWFQLDALGVSLSPIVEGDTFGFALTTPRASAASAIDLLIQILLEPHFTPEDVAAAKAVLIERYQSQLEDPSSFSSDRLNAQLFEFSGLYPSLLNRISDIRKATEKDLSSWWSKIAGDITPSLLILGDTEGTEYVTPFARKLSTSKWKPPALEKLSILKAPKLPVLVEGTLRGIPSPLLVFGFRGPNFVSPQTEAIQLGRYLFDGLFPRTSVHDYYYLRVFEGEAIMGGGPPTAHADRILKQMAELIASDSKLNAALLKWQTATELEQLDPIEKGLSYYRWLLFYPNMEGINKAQKSSRSMSLTQLREALHAVFAPQNLIVFSLSEQMTHAAPPPSPAK